MALTCLFLCSFLVVHLLGNLPLLTGNQEAFNAYSHFMTTFPLIKAVSYLLYASILLHSIDGLVLARQNMAARPAGYVKYNGAANANWSSRNMALLGTITLLFLIIHLKSFWFEMHFGFVPNWTDAEGNLYKDLYTITVAAFQQTWYALFYVVAMLGLGLHLWHGFASAFQTMGWSHPRYTPMIKALGYGFAIMVPLLFASIPLYILLT